VARSDNPCGLLLLGLWSNNRVAIVAFLVFIVLVCIFSMQQIKFCCRRDCRVRYLQEKCVYVEKEIFADQPEIKTVELLQHIVCKQIYLHLMQ